MSEMSTIYYVLQIILGDIVIRGGGDYRLSILMQSIFSIHWLRRCKGLRLSIGRFLVLGFGELLPISWTEKSVTY